MTNTRKTALLLIIGGWGITITILLILDDLLLSKDIPSHLYIFLIAFILILYWLFKSIRYYHQRIQQLHAKIKTTQEDIREINNNIRLHTESMAQGNISQETETYNLFRSFQKNNPGFIQKLRETIPRITEGEEKLCTLIYLKKRNKEIAQILQIDEKSIYTSRSRLKHKLPLGEGETMDHWVQNIEKKPSEASGGITAVTEKASEAYGGVSVTTEIISEASADILDIQTKESSFTN